MKFIKNGKNFAQAGGGGDARVRRVLTLRVGSDARVGSVHCGDVRVGSLKHHLNGVCNAGAPHRGAY